MSQYDRFRNIKFAGIGILILALLLGGSYFLFKDKGSSPDDIQDMRLSR